MTLGELVVVFGVIGTAAGVTMHWLGAFDKAASVVQKWISIFRSPKADAGFPVRTVVPHVRPERNALWWHVGKIGASPAMQVVADMEVANTWSGDVHLPRAVLRYRDRFLRRRKIDGRSDVKDSRSQYSGKYPIRPNELSWVRAHFFWPDARPPVPGIFTADLAIVDQFGNEHWLKRCRFRHTEHMFDPE